MGQNRNWRKASDAPSSGFQGKHEAPVGFLPGSLPEPQPKPNFLLQSSLPPHLKNSTGAHHMLSLQTVDSPLCGQRTYLALGGCVRGAGAGWGVVGDYLSQAKTTVGIAVAGNGA